MMPINITMPALSPTMEEGSLTRWLVAEGDHVSSGDMIAEIETDKANMEIEAVDTGIVAKIVVPAGTERVKVNAIIAVLAGPDEDIEDSATSAGSALIDVERQGPPKVGEPPSQGSVAMVGTDACSTPAVWAVGPSSSRREDGGAPRIFATPIARRLAREAQIDISAIRGSGSHGRVVKADIESALARREHDTPVPLRPVIDTTSVNGVPDAKVLELFEEGSYELVPHDAMRKTIACRLAEAKRTIPHFYLTVDCEIDALLDLSQRLNGVAPIKATETGTTETGKAAYRISINDMVIKAMAMALAAVPDANVSWTEAGMLRHKRADVAVAVSVPGGLITPIVRKADLKSLSAISNEMKDLATRGREGRLRPDEFQGGTAAVSNLGMLGVNNFSAIVNPPHATILAIGAGTQRAVVKGGEIGIAMVMSVTLSTDHRAVDGALGAELMQVFKNLVENPLALLV